MTPDAPARRRALGDLDSTLLVEAAAGTGKTSLLAARLTLMLARGIPPGAIAAITFTDYAAGELAARVRGFVDELRAGAVPQVLRDALLAGPSADQLTNLEAAAGTMDELTASTIHGFCRDLLRDHAVTAGIDPGAVVMDADAAEASFSSVFDRWLSTRLQGHAQLDDPIAVLSADDPRRLATMLRGLARFRLDHRSARPVPTGPTGRPDLEFADSADTFRRWAAGVPQEPTTRAVVEELGRLSAFYADSFAQPPEFSALWRLAHPERVRCMRRDGFGFVPLRCETSWRSLAGDEAGAMYFDEARRLFARATTRFEVLLGRIATALVAMLSVELDEVLDEYARFKRDAAVLDFDDLVERARAIVRDDDAVRRAVASRYRYILVDEFQDVDPIQAELVLRITAENHAPDWRDAVQRPGALFLVGDPKQAIYGFRGADPRCYDDVKRMLLDRWPDSVLGITANFRSRPGLTSYVNRCFSGPLSRERQPGYAAMDPVRSEPAHGFPCASKLVLRLPPDANAVTLRETEAEAVADVCATLVGSLEIDDREGGTRRLEAGDIALLTPTGTDLWRYERALNARGLAVASQAGKSFFGRQEVLDLMTLARVIADPRDTLAFGALMRGPLVGLTDEALLDVAEALRLRHERGPRVVFSVLTDPADIDDSALARTLAILRSLGAKADTTTPLQLLSDAVAKLHVRTVVAARGADRCAAASANVDAFLDLSRGYAVRGLKRFVQDLDAAWRNGSRRQEGRYDGGGGAVSILTVHASKGLEFDVTIPINAGTRLVGRRTFVHRASDDTLHWVIGDVVPPDLTAAVREADEARAREGERLWYVAATRAREMVVVPEVTCAVGRSWARLVDLGHDALPAFDPRSFRAPVTGTATARPNLQDAATFAAEAATVAASVPALTWLRPSDDDPDRLSGEAATLSPDVAIEVHLVGAGRTRGLVLHKLLEEVVTGETAERLDDLEARAGALLAQLELDGRPVPDPAEMARTVVATFALPDVAAMRHGLVVEVPVRAFVTHGGGIRAVDGRADAVFVGPSGIEAVVDWKSDVVLEPLETERHRRQLSIYLAATGAPRGALVYVTHGIVRWVVGEIATA